MTTILAKRTGDTPHLGGDPILTPTHTSGETETLDYDAEALWPSGVALSVDEIDDDKTDTFAPFLRDKTCRDVPPNGPDDFLSKIHFEGDESFQNELRNLCSEYADIFSDKPAPQAAALKPFEINLPKQRWEVPSNCTPVRPQSSKKDHYLRTSIEEMFEDGVIERSDPAYYSHLVMVNKSADTYRTCIDHRSLNECIEPASFPLPNIKHLFERIGNKKPDIFNRGLPSSTLICTPPNLYRIHAFMFHGGVPIHEIAFWPLSCPLLLSRANGDSGCHMGCIT